MSNRQRRETRAESGTGPSGRQTTRYYAQFPAGTQDLLLDALPISLPEHVEVTYADDSAIVFDSSASADAVAEVPYFKNVFVVMTSVPRAEIEKAVFRLSKASTGATSKLRKGTIVSSGSCFTSTVH